MSIRCQSWSLILSNYHSLLDNNWRVQPMIDLVNYIISSSYSVRLFAYTSLDILIVSIYEDIDKFSESLHIKYDQDTAIFLFSYYGKNNAVNDPEWEKTYEFGLGIDKFNKFIEMIKW